MDHHRGRPVGNDAFASGGILRNGGYFMNVSHLAVIVPVDGLPQDMEEANQEVWGTVTHLLLPHLGKCYAKFYPARKAWGYRVPETFGVVLGKITPDRFLRL